ncbi:MAG: TMEM175 family protein [Planctomycetota bacterium]|nr:TMEM175 family protein [Planctomycetota bacterium]
METGRLEAFSDGVIAIIITIMVLEMKVPHSTELEALRPIVPVLLSYTLSFIYVGIYWNNHHHLFMAAEKVNGGILWANLHLLFWLSLIPFVTGWVGENHLSSIPAALYGVVLLMAAIAYYVLQLVIVSSHGRNSMIAEALGADFKGKVSPVIYLAAIPFAFVSPWIAHGLYVVVAMMWLVPDRRLARAIEACEAGKANEPKR